MVELDQKGVSHSRRKYCLLDLIGDLGGITDVLIRAFGFFMFPIAYHSFILNATQKLYFGRSSQPQHRLEDIDQSKNANFA